MWEGGPKHGLFLRVTGASGCFHVYLLGDDTDVADMNSTIVANVHLAHAFAHYYCLFAMIHLPHFCMKK